MSFIKQKSTLSQAPSPEGSVRDGRRRSRPGRANRRSLFLQRLVDRRRRRRGKADRTADEPPRGHMARAAEHDEHVPAVVGEQTPLGFVQGERLPGPRYAVASDLSQPIIQASLSSSVLTPPRPGPPGTGKSSTIVGLVSALLSGKAPLPRQRQSGCIIHPGKTMGATVSGRTAAARNRILVCAATNQAVDGLAWRIRNGSVGPTGRVGDFEMARFGSLPWEQGGSREERRDAPGPGVMSEMENFL